MAALDVFSEEPFTPSVPPLTIVPTVGRVPHPVVVCISVFEQFYSGIEECLQAWLEGKPLVRVLPS
jgi:phosphoglycerate dehydrogenase-like enzyme